MVNNPRISASFGTLDEFASFAENMSDVIIWSDFDRVNETHFWSKQRNIFIEPDLDSGLGRRNGIELDLNFHRLSLSNVIIEVSPPKSFRSVVLADGNGTLINSNSNSHAYCICKHLGIK